MGTLSLSNIINISITNTPQGIATRNVNAVGLFTADQPNNIDEFRTYISAAAVAQDYGSNSVTAAVAQAIFAQSPNILSGNGQLVIMPLQHNSAGGAPVSATSGNLTTADITTTLASILLVSNGSVQFTIDGVAYPLKNLNFTLATNFADIATILQNNLDNGIVTPTATGFKVTSKKVGTNSSVAISAVAGSAGTDLNAVGYFKGASASIVAGTNAVGETLIQAIERTMNDVSYTPVITTLDLQDSAIELNAAFIQANDFIYLQHVASTQDIGGVGAVIQQAGETQTRILLHTSSMADANLMKAAYTGRCFSTDFSGSNTAGTMNLKQLATISPDEIINQTEYNQEELDGVDAYVSYSGFPAVYSTGGNDFVDNVYANLALKFALQAAGFNFLATTNTKVPQTENGMNGLKNAYAQVLQQFVTNGTIAPGSWTSSETFGDPELFRQNIQNAGYYIYSQPVSQQDPVARAARQAPLVQIAIKRAGAIHTSSVIVVINP